jgi:hypothetical protein
MITIQIGGSGERTLEEATPQWINEQIKRRRDDDQPACVKVHIDVPPVNLALATPGCAGSSGGGGRLPNQREQRIFELWTQRGLNDPNFAGGNLVAFLKQVQDML